VWLRMPARTPNSSELSSQTASFFCADYCNLNTAVLHTTFFCAVVADRVGRPCTADLKFLGIGRETDQMIADRFSTLQRKRRILVCSTYIVGGRLIEDIHRNALVISRTFEFASWTNRLAQQQSRDPP
jgi:hypothetical protein